MLIHRLTIPVRRNLWIHFLSNIKVKRKESNSQFLFLVEGATEFLLLPYFYKQITGKTIEEDGISVISCNGISYKNYLEIAKKTNKKISVITDNDGKQNRIDEAITFNETTTLQHIFLGATTDDWTWEACLYNLNKAALDGMIM